MMRTFAGAVIVLAAVSSGCATSRSAANLPPDVDPKDPLAATVLMQQGQALAGQGKLAAAIAKFEAALRLQPENPTVHNLIGRAELDRGNPTKALEHFNRALQLAPSYSDARNNRGSAYVALNQFAQAEADFLTVLGDRTYANRAGAYFNLGSLYLGRGNLAAAEENLRRSATPAGPVEAFVLLGQVEERLGRPEQAESAYREALQRAPERADVALTLAELLERLGRGAEAKELYGRVIAIAPNSEEAAKARARVGK